MFCVKVKIISNKKIGQKYFKIRLEAPKIAGEALPGQFVMARISDDYEPLLRRPFSIHRVIGKEIEIFYEIKGKGTEILSKKKAGEYLDVIGPLGNGFDLRRAKGEGRRAIIVAGGMGVAPLTFLAEKLRSIEPRISNFEIAVLLGARTKEQVSCEKEFKNLGCDVKIATDDGSHGFKGRITELLEEILATGYTLTGTGRLYPYGHKQATGKNKKQLAACSLQPAAVVYACGPKPMLKEITRLAECYHIPAWVSLEEYMACGFGACLGCVVQTKNGYKYVCKEGPVFNTEELLP
ncbi:MAG: dihydroorotate dehydrogenase electron transfer subunit [Candidatus Omnitrophota bacterium]|nr:dihydroorotate dehydrogenase electron transfer subunit [Candidatus Omnitrophota bacterium]